MDSAYNIPLHSPPSSLVEGPTNRNKYKNLVIYIPLMRHSVNNMNWEFDIKIFFLVKRVPDWGPELRESEKTVLYPQIIILLISYIIIYYH
jgi:hypothetical protein